jgi:hypothetical protein
VCRAAEQAVPGRRKVGANVTIGEARVMRMGNLDRRACDGGCVVCGATDARMLAYTRLEDGTRVTVCGSHKTAHRRAARLASSIDELRAMLGDRRKKTA